MSVIAFDHVAIPTAICWSSSCTMPAARHRRSRWRDCDTVFAADTGLEETVEFGHELLVWIEIQQEYAREAVIRLEHRD